MGFALICFLSSYYMIEATPLEAITFSLSLISSREGPSCAQEDPSWAKDDPTWAQNRAKDGPTLAIGER